MKSSSQQQKHGDSYITAGSKHDGTNITSHRAEALKVQGLPVEPQSEDQKKASRKNTSNGYYYSSVVNKVGPG